MKKQLLLPLAALCAAITPATAAVTYQSVWHLGEAGSLGTSNRPIDSADADGTFNNFASGDGATVGTTNPAAPGSTAYLSFPDTGSFQGYYSPSPSQTIPPDNYGIDLWTRVATADLGQAGARIFLFGGTGSFLSLTFNDGGNGWRASVNGVSYIGTSTTAIGDEWAHLALIRNNGVNEFYVNGTLIGSNTTATTSSGAFHLAIQSGGGGNFKGDIDELRFFTFNMGEFNIADLNAVPEPSVVVLGALGALGLLRRRR